MSEKLLKRKCVILFKTFDDRQDATIGVFKNKKEADRYLNWLDPKNKDAYKIAHSKRYVYVDTFSTIKE